MGLRLVSVAAVPQAVAVAVGVGVGVGVGELVDGPLDAGADRLAGLPLGGLLLGVDAQLQVT